MNLRHVLLLPFAIIIYKKLGITHPQVETSGRLKQTTEEIFSLWNLSSSQSPKGGCETLTLHFSNEGRKKGLRWSITPSQCTVATGFLKAHPAPTVAEQDTPQWEGNMHLCHHSDFSMQVCVCLCVEACVWERGRNREGEIAALLDLNRNFSTLKLQLIMWIQVGKKWRIIWTTQTLRTHRHKICL